MVADLIALFFTVIFPVFEALGIATAFHAVMNARTSQGAIAWAVSLVSFPYVTLPLYWIFGRHRFHGYVETLRQGHLEHQQQVDTIVGSLQEASAARTVALPAPLKVYENLARFPFTAGNRVTLLVDGQATFNAMFQSIDEARNYILVQYFIIKDDELGRELKRRLINRAKSGVRVSVLYDEIGCHQLPAQYLDDLHRAGVKTSGFKTTRGKGNRFQLNFRNHRKITVVDGRVAYMGGYNVGDEYMGRNPKFGRWRDTHIKIEGPAVQNVQFVFTVDWYWANRKGLDLAWEQQPMDPEGSDLLVLSSGPADKIETCSLMFVHAIQSARSRIWIASPYFIPNEAIVEALQLAALRGVDVSIMLPMKPDHRIVYMAGFSYMAKLNMPGIRFYRYEPGFLHQKVFLVDDKLAGVGTANMDNRSFRLNFEVTALISNRKFAQEVEHMLTEDFSKCRTTPADEYLKRALPFRFGVRLARLLSPIL